MGTPRDGNNICFNKYFHLPERDAAQVAGALLQVVDQEAVLEGQVVEEPTRVPVQELHGARLGSTHVPVSLLRAGRQAPVDGSDEVLGSEGWVGQVGVLPAHPGQGGLEVAVGVIAGGVQVEVLVHLQQRWLKNRSR